MVAFTGAGVSTASGVADFRSPGGVWSRHRPVPFDEFLSSAEARRRYWQYKKESWFEMARARPNAAHLLLARLEAEERLLGVITQNIDGLHQAAGSRRVVELHGTNLIVECLGCGRGSPADEIYARLEATAEPPPCGDCGGLLKPATISFGQPLRSDVLAAAERLVLGCDLLLVLGSSLVVYPAASLLPQARAAGSKLVIVNRDSTPFDGLADVVLHGEVEQLLPSLAPRDGSPNGSGEK